MCSALSLFPADTSRCRRHVTLQRPRVSISRGVHTVNGEGTEEELDWVHSAVEEREKGRTLPHRYTHSDLWTSARNEPCYTVP